MIILVDFVRLTNSFLHFLPDSASDSYLKLKQISALSIFVISTVVITYGFFNAKNTRVRIIELEVPRKQSKAKQIKAVLVTDIHLGMIIKNSHVEKLVEKVNSLNPDIILLGGDIVDEDIRPVIANNLGEILTNLKSKYGTYAITGNHEYIGGVEEACKYLTDHKITFVRDSAVKIDDSFYIVGREDRNIGSFTTKGRKPLEDLMKEVTDSLPVILMDHQPFKLTETAEFGVDISLSGHTHHGQMWPLNFVTQQIFRLSWGYEKIKNTHFYVSCGFGTWGPPVRVGNHPEIVEFLINLKP
jgi:predicted MPP superfamily phosphohydrolase